MADTSFLPHKAIFSLEDAQENFEALEGKVGALAAAPAARAVSYGRVSTDIAGTGSMADVPSMGFAVAANEVWSFSAYIFITASSGGNYTFQFTGPTSPASFKFGGASGGPTGSNAVVVSGFSSALSVPVSVTTETLVRINGTLVNGPNAGTVQLQQKSVAITQTVKASSYLLATKGA